MSGTKRLGLIVNPWAGIGGRVGLKGSDGADVIRKAVELGAVRESPQRAQLALARLAQLRDRVEIVTCPGEMGADECRAAGFAPRVLEEPRVLEGAARPRGVGLPDGARVTTGEDTERAARAMVDMGVDLLLFAGGDGTARNIHDAICHGDVRHDAARSKLPVLGIPAGVKIHSAIFANTPAQAGDLAALYLSGGRVHLREVEVMDIDEEAYRDNRVSARLYGYLTVPFMRELVQSAKAGSPASDLATMRGIATDIVNSMHPERVYIIGPGTTTRAVMEALGLENTLLGVDVVLGRKLVARDANEDQLLSLIEKTPATIVVTVIGGQGHIFGRGNQQISPRVIWRVGRKNIVVAAAGSKLLSLGGRPMLVDTGDEELDRELSGYLMVITGLKERIVYQVAGATASSRHGRRG
jgi:predicted polyphosphate/ATP-dependent NAD kinase